MTRGDQCRLTSISPCSCCGAEGICGYGPDFCGDGCQSNCDATAMCGKFSEGGSIPCGLDLCCSWGKSFLSTLLPESTFASVLASTNTRQAAGAVLATSTALVLMNGPCAKKALESVKWSRQHSAARTPALQRDE